MSAVVRERVAGDERVAVETQVGVLGLDQRVDGGRVLAAEDVEAESAGQRVALRVARSAVDHVVEGRADQPVVARAAHQRQRDEVDRMRTRQ